MADPIQIINRLKLKNPPANTSYSEVVVRNPVSKEVGVVSKDAFLQAIKDNINFELAEKTKAEIDVLISSNGLIPGTLYKISGVHPTLYNDGVLPGTTIYLRALTNNALSKEGHGEFWNPKYNQAENGFGIWTNLSSYNTSALTGMFNPNENIIANNGATGKIFANFDSNQFIAISGNWALATSITGAESGATANIASVLVKTYDAGSKAIWGGYSWTNVNGNIGVASDALNLNGEWLKDTYTAINYKLVLDVVEYDYDNDWINRRFEVGSNNDVKASLLTASWYSHSTINAINAFQFGNPMDSDTYKGIGANRVIDSYFECINFRGFYIFNNTLEAGSDIKNNTLENNSTIESNTLRGDCHIKNNLCSSGYIYNNVLIGYNSSIDSNIISTNGAIDENLIEMGSRIFNNILTQSGTIKQNVGTGLSSIKLCDLKQSSIRNTILSGNSEISNIRLQDNKIIQKLTIDGGSIAGDLSAATLIYGNFTKTAYKRPDGVTKIRYYNDFDTMVIADLTD